MTLAEMMGADLEPLATSTLLLMRSQISEPGAESIDPDGTSEALSHSMRETKHATTYDVDEFLSLKNDYESKVKQYDENRKALQDEIDEKVTQLQRDIDRKVSINKYQNDRGSLCDNLR